MKKPQPDKNGNFVFGPALTKTVPLVVLIVFSVLIIVISVYSLISGNYLNVKTVILRIVMCAVIFLISCYLLIRSPKYVITNDKILLYGRWELQFNEIREVTLHDNFFGFVEIHTGSELFSVFAFDVSCSLKHFSEILTERISAYEQHRA